MRRRLAGFIAVVQTILWSAHALVFITASAVLDLRTPGPRLAFGIGLGGLSLTFVSASLLAFWSFRGWVKGYYRAAVLWLGTLNYLFFGSLLYWGIEGLNRLWGEGLSSRGIGIVLLGLSLLAVAAAVLNASWLRVSRISVTLPGLPEAWRGRRIAAVSDVHLGHVRGVGFLRRLVERISREKPDLVVIPGDLYDGTAVDAGRLAEPWRDLSAPLGIYFVTGNHEEFSDSSRFTETLATAGVRTLNNEMVLLDGLQIVGIHDGDHRNPSRLASLLGGLNLDRRKASVLLAHSPIHLSIAEQAGVSLQISGHTHGGQFLPWTWIVSGLYGAFARGLHAWGGLQVLTTVGAGTWGPPMRLGTNPEIVMIQLA